MLYGSLCKIGNGENTNQNEIMLTEKTKNKVDNDNILKEEKQESTLEPAYELPQIATNHNNTNIVIIISVAILILILCVIFIIAIMTYKKL